MYNPFESYFVVSSIISDSLTVIIIIIICNALDFWTVKNVTGRLLVGLKWENKRLPDGTEKWIYECKVDESKNNKVDSTFFWGG
jgi:hypothetical protein